MRTTVRIDDHLLAEAREQARRRRQTLGELVEDALRRELGAQAGPGPPPEIPVSRGGTGARPGIDLTSNAAVLAALDEGLPLDQLR